MQNLEGKVALVTGASRGIGKAIALELAQHGSAVVINYLANKDAAEAVAKEVTNAGCRAEVIQADVSVQEDAQHLVQQTVETLGGLDILVNNAGIERGRTIRRMSAEEWHTVISTNLNSVFYCTNAAIPHLVNRGGGRIINMGSLFAQTGNIGQVNYSASKGGVIAFTKGLALELAHYNITVNAVCPGYIETDMTAPLEERSREELLKQVPMARFGTAEEVASLVRYLVIEGDYITGQQFNINGVMYM
ncbi:MAG: 3-oxoacyl-ACP reductase family protein [Dehalococcoidia bacterium]